MSSAAHDLISMSLLQPLRRAYRLAPPSPPPAGLARERDRALDATNRSAVRHARRVPLGPQPRSQGQRQRRRTRARLRRQLAPARVLPSLAVGAGRVPRDPGTVATPLPARLRERAGRAGGRGRRPRLAPALSDAVLRDGRGEAHADGPGPGSVGVRPARARALRNP